jgi:hypothetical protein
MKEFFVYAIIECIYFEGVYDCREIYGDMYSTEELARRDFIELLNAGAVFHTKWVKQSLPSDEYPRAIEYWSRSDRALMIEKIKVLG